MKRFDPFKHVNTQYGAPMGRRDASTVISPENGKLCARHCGGYDCYDKGGAYWGAPLNIWAVWNHGKGEETVTYVRAANRATALVFAQIEGN
jgi:hypothetical protein